MSCVPLTRTLGSATEGGGCDGSGGLIAPEGGGAGGGGRRARGEQRQVAGLDHRGEGDRAGGAGDRRRAVDAQQGLLQVGVRGGRYLADDVGGSGDRVRL